jgi:DNA mismatch repair protein MutL
MNLDDDHGCRIACLPEGTRRLISSGQVISEPSRVVKELVENALDAKAQKIDVHISGASNFSKVEVMDDGEGIPLSDRGTCAQGHFTSKIQRFEDIQELDTYGFRGEALHSVCASAGSVAITTRTATDAVGQTVRIGGGGAGNGQLVRACDKSVSCLRGTRVVVGELLVQFPVRHKVRGLHGAATTSHPF